MEKKKNPFSNILGGGILKEDFIVKQSKLLILIVIFAIFFISNRYDCLKKITEIETLERDLRDIKYENLVISTKLTKNSRQSQVEALLEREGINLKASKTPAYEIKK
ncbi:hypothetical protein AwDysgo_06970 [Bacteroidales bacterium]|nr:hypothetical protein AwDysgo_06970 [Bacteroidales bacterium]